MKITQPALYRTAQGEAIWDGAAAASGAGSIKPRKTFFMHGCDPAGNSGLERFRAKRSFRSSENALPQRVIKRHPIPFNLIMLYVAQGSLPATAAEILETTAISPSARRCFPLSVDPYGS